MRNLFGRFGWFTPALVVLLVAGGISGPGAARADERWLNLTGMAPWKGKPTGWEEVGDVRLKPQNQAGLVGEAGSGVIFNGNGPNGRGSNLVTKETFGDVEVHLEFAVPKGSNSGIKLEGVYEIQIFDSSNVKKPTASHCGGIYPRAELLPRYRHIDEGYPPKANACKPAGEWQTLDIVFLAPRFDGAGKKVSNARFVSVKLNGVVVQENQDVPSPTGHVWREPEHPTGPILLQGDHGPVAFRNFRVKRLQADR